MKTSKTSFKSLMNKKMSKVQKSGSKKATNNRHVETTRNAKINLPIEGKWVMSIG